MSSCASIWIQKTSGVQMMLIICILQIEVPLHIILNPG